MGKSLADPETWTAPWCDCNQPGVAYHPVGNEAFCHKGRARVLAERTVFKLREQFGLLLYRLGL